MSYLKFYQNKERHLSEDFCKIYHEQIENMYNHTDDFRLYKIVVRLVLLIKVNNVCDNTNIHFNAY